MRCRPLFPGGPEISVVTLGTWAAGGNDWGPVDDDEVLAAISRALDLGINAIDTADAYGWGHSEELVGRALRGRRDEVFLATKLGIRKDGFSLAPDYVPAACEASLRRLGTDVIDLYQIHWPGDPATPLEVSWEAMAGLQDQGKVRHIGVSNFDCAQLDACERARHVASVQNEYSMLARGPEGEVIPWCAAHGTGFLSYGSLAYGILTGKYGPRTTFPRSDWRSGASGFEYYDRLFAQEPFRRNLARVEGLREVAAGLGATVAQLAVAWILREPAVSSAICGAKRPAQIEETVAAAGLALDASAVQAVEAALAV
ncbi:MAG: aldo/keto reductase [Acidobacteria bacterium]|nr:aldo/keto reductase [Acidobacteriota bacterium]